jgi:phenylacetate-CoA ligase
MGWYTKILQKTALPIWLRRYHRSSALGHWKFLLQSQYWSRRQLLDYQWERLQELLHHAYTTTVYYRRIFDERGLTPASFASVEDLNKLPILTRDDVFEHSDELISSRYDRSDLIEFFTGGTTGQQARMWIDQESYNRKLGAAWRFEGWLGYEPCDRLALFWPAHMDVPKQESFQARFARLHMMRQEIIYGGSLNDHFARAAADRLMAFAPEYLRVFPTAFSNFVEHARNHDLKLPSVRAVMSTGEGLYPSQRKTISEQFDCPVFDMYSSREVGNTACECDAHDGLHIAMETSLVEFVSDGEPVAVGTEGAILITDLTNYGMPVIRYQINDYSMPLAGDCPCGRKLSRMSAGVGRLQDCFYGSDGTRHSGNVLGIHLTVGENNVAIGQTQFVQKSVTEFLVRVTNKPEPTAETFEFLERRTKELIGDDISVRFEVVDKIPPEASGKTRFVICEIPQDERPG